MTLSSIGLISPYVTHNVVINQLCVGNDNCTVPSSHEMGWGMFFTGQEEQCVLHTNRGNNGGMGRLGLVRGQGGVVSYGHPLSSSARHDWSHCIAFLDVDIIFSLFLTPLWLKITKLYWFQIC